MLLHIPSRRHSAKPLVVCCFLLPGSVRQAKNRYCSKTKNVKPKNLCQSCIQRIGICDGRVLAFRHADTEVDFCFIVEDNICCLIINVEPELKPIKDLLPIVLPSSPAIANTFVGSSNCHPLNGSINVEASISVNLMLVEVMSFKRNISSGFPFFLSTIFFPFNLV